MKPALIQILSSMARKSGWALLLLAGASLAAACGSGDDDPADPCSDEPCRNGGTCLALDDGFECQCLSGFSGPTCEVVEGDDAARIIFLHHSTGGVIWGGGVSDWLAGYNTDNGTSYAITDQEFPKDSPYGWNNYPYDYWNIWVAHAGDSPYQQEPTLEILSQSYELVVFKHCFPVSAMEADSGNPDVASATKSRENYELQYQALKAKMHEFPDTLFLVWTGAALVEGATDEQQAQRARDFFAWVIDDWDEPGDNIFVWDFRRLETEGGLYLLPENSAGDSHPNGAFAERVAPLFGQRMVDVLEGRGDSGSLTGEP